MTRSVISTLVLITLLAVACSSAHTPGSEFASPAEAPSLNLLAGTVTGLDPRASVTLRLELWAEGPPAEHREVVVYFDVSNGRWQQGGFDLTPGRYRLTAEAEDYVNVPKSIVFQVPEDGIIWRYTHLNFEFLHPNDALARFGAPLCPEPPVHGGVYVAPQGTSSPTPSDSAQPVLVGTPPWPPGTCYAGHFYDSELPLVGLRGQVVDLPTGQTVTITLYVLPPVPGENYMVGPAPPADGSWVYPPDVTDLEEQPPIVPDWPLTATLTTSNGSCGLVDPSLAGHKYLVVANATSDEAWPPAYEIVVFGGKMPGFPSSVNFSFRSEATGPPPPTEAPPEAPLPTSTIVTPPSAYAAQDAARQTAIAARATASPFPTVGPSTVQLGEPSVASARRDGLSLEVRLAKNTYLAGEGGRAEAILRNEGPETIFVGDGGGQMAWPTLLDERGVEPAPWPWFPWSMPSGPPLMAELSPGQVVTGSLTFQVPPLDQALDHSYTLWVEVRFSRPTPDQPQGPDNLWLHLEAGPIPLQVSAPSAGQQLKAELQADRYGWTLQVTDEKGGTPSGPFWGQLEATSFNGGHSRPLADEPGGAWSASLDPYLSQDGAEVALRAWVAAPGYVTAAATATVPGTAGADATFYTGEPPAHQTYDTLEAAQAVSHFSLYRLGVLPPGARVDGVQVETWTSDDGYRVEATQTYRLGNGGWLELTQMVTSQPWAGFGWGAARYDPEASVVAVGQTTGYAIRRFGWRLLDWKCGDAGLELRAPVEALGLEELVAVAARVRSPDGTCPPAPTPAPPPTAPAPPTATPAE
jgi:hypothetical protein